MARIDELSPAEKELVASLPYKVGVWMGQAADEGGDKDDRLEMQALERVLDEFSKGIKVPPFVRQVCSEALERRVRWDSWSSSYMNVPDECRQAVAVLKAVEAINDRDIRFYRSALRKVAIAVAEAYGEFGMLDEESGAEKAGGFLDKLGEAIGAFTGADEPSPENISPAEQEALSALVKALTEEGE